MKENYQALQIEVVHLQNDVVRTSGEVEGTGSNVGRFGYDLEDWFE